MVALTADEAGALRERLPQDASARSATGTLSVSANASTSVTFTDAEKATVLDVLVQWLAPAGVRDGDGLLALKRALAFDLARC